MAKPIKTRRSFRLSQDTIRLLGILSKQLGINITAIIELAVHELAAKYNRAGG